MEPVTSESLNIFLKKLGDHYAGAGKLYLLGGSALSLLGNPRSTIDIDYKFDLETGNLEDFERLIKQLAFEMRLDLESVPLDEFIPLPPDAYQRRRFFGKFGNIEVFLFDLYSIALSKIARGFEADLDDVIFLLRNELIEIVELERLFQIILPQVSSADIDPI